MIAAETDRGRLRDHNEDSYLASLPLAAVADGVGGHNAGEVASRIAVEVLESWRQRLVLGGGDELKDAALAAHHTIHSKALGDPVLAGMATTLTCAWVERGTVHIAHVGDSRAYLLREGVLTQLTEDHTQVQDMVRRGRLTPEEATRHPYRNRLFQALGGGMDVVVDLLKVDLTEGDRLLLCSDGLTEEVSEDEILRVLDSHSDPETACRELVSLANAAGGKDNVTVVILNAGAA